MKAIIVGAGNGFTTQSNGKPKAITQDLMGRRILDWIISSLKSAKINQHIFVGGYEIEKIIENYPNLKFYENSDWENNNVLHSLFYAENEMDEGFIFSYADIVYKPSVVKKMLNADGDIRIVIDKNWKSRYWGREGSLLLDAEKVIVSDNNIVTEIGKKIPITNQVYGEFIGLAYFSKNGARILKETFHELKINLTENTPFHEASSFKNAFLTDILQELVNRGLTINVVDIDGDWATLDNPQDLSQFIFGTKGETLERLKPLLKNGRICEQIRFEVVEWFKDKKYWIEAIQKGFDSKKVIVRSSAISEDSWESSMAGAYCSIGDVEVSPEKLIDAIEKVIDSYGQSEDNGSNQVLVQPQIDDVEISGVLFTCDLETGAQYYVINYDDTSKRTDTVTSGSKHEFKTIYAYKNADTKLEDTRVQRLINVAKELEALTNCSTLDIEFAINHTGDLYIFQVRPITAIKVNYSYLNDAISKEIESIKTFISERQNKLPNVYGKTTLFGEMPDWNPAEIIGTRPKPLASSLYHYLILNNTWREAREKIGYVNPFPESLMVSLGGKPYIDIRNSFNSFLPKGLPDELAEKIIDYYIARLNGNPEYHDKVEFKIVLTSLSFDFEQHANELRDSGFTIDEIRIFKERLLEFTNNVVSGKVAPIDEQLALVQKLEERRRKILNITGLNSTNIPRILRVLLDDCIKYGTEPFTILARYAFIGTSFLKTLIQRNILTKKEIDNFYHSFETITSIMLSDLNKVNSGILPRKQFLQKYGHLRPGTYDVLSFRYDEKPELYLKDLGIEKMDFKKVAISKEKNINFKLTDFQYNQIAKLLKEYGFEFSVDEMFFFIKKSIVSREYSKYEFTKNLSEALKLIGSYADILGFSKEDIAFISIDTLLVLAHQNEVKDIHSQLNREIMKAKEKYKITQMLRLPQLITCPEDAEIVKMIVNKPNFVTQQSVVGQALFVENLNMEYELDDKIVLIEGADPGFDWIFTYKIKGLVTKYGGAASHMTIRCAELGVPAAIGCGEAIFTRLTSSKNIELNCGGEYVKGL